jgi:hypothetical protein
MEIIGYKTHIAAAGESFDSVAFVYYGNEFMADKLMKVKKNSKYNHLIVFEGGEKLLIPVYDDIESTETLAPWRR